MTDADLIAYIEAQGYTNVIIDSDHRFKWVEARKGSDFRMVRLSPHFRVTPTMLAQRWGAEQ